MPGGITGKSIVIIGACLVGGFTAGWLVDGSTRAVDAGLSEAPSDDATTAITRSFDFDPQSSAAIAKEVAFLSALDTATSAEFPALVEAALGEPDSSTRRSQLRMTMRQWSEIDPEGALAFAVAQEELTIYQALIPEWTIHDREAAIAAVSAMQESHPEHFERGLYEIGHSLARDLGEEVYFLRWAGALGEHQKHIDGYLYEKVIRRLAKDDVEQALEIAGEQSGYVAKLNTFRYLAGAWAETDPEAALEWARSRGTDEFSDRSVEQVLRVIAKTDPERAGKELTLLTSPQVDREKFGREVGKRFVQSGDPEKAVAWLETYVGGGAVSKIGRDLVTEALTIDLASGLKTWEAVTAKMGNPTGWDFDLSNYRGDIAAQLDTLQAMPGDHAARSRMRTAMLGEMSSRNFDDALDWIEKNGSQIEDITTIGSVGYKDRIAAYHKLFLEASDWERAFEKSNEILTDSRGMIQKQMLIKYRYGNLPLALEIYEQLPPEEQDEYTAGFLAINLTSEGVDTALEWVDSLPENISRDYAMDQVIKHWSSRDPAGLSQWATQIEDPDIVDKAAARLAITLMSDDAEGAAQWANVITDDQERLKNQQAVFLSWYNKDPDAAQRAFPDFKKDELGKFLYFPNGSKNPAIFFE